MIFARFMRCELYHTWPNNVAPNVSYWCNFLQVWICGCIASVGTQGAKNNLKCCSVSLVDIHIAENLLIISNLIIHMVILMVQISVSAPKLIWNHVFSEICIGQYTVKLWMCASAEHIFLQSGAVRFCTVLIQLIVGESNHIRIVILILFKWHGPFR